VQANEPIVFATAFEALSRAFRLEGNAITQLSAAGVDLDRLQVAYSLSSFLTSLDVVASTLADKGTPATRYRLLGRAYVKGWVGTKMGLAAVTVGKLLGPKRTLLRMQQTFRTSANYVVTKAHERPPRAIELLVKAGDEFVPSLPKDCGRLIDYRHGLLEGVLEQFGVNDLVDIVERDDAKALARYLVKW
jgi:uncharacterized protein (TIGR02265 family)